VYRGDSAEGPFERLTEVSISGGGTTDLPRYYRYEDHSTQPGRTYYYYVETISTNGSRSKLTPIRAFEARQTCQDKSVDRDDFAATVFPTPPERVRRRPSHGILDVGVNSHADAQVSAALKRQR
jgi:hypothetical protein